MLKWFFERFFNKLIIHLKGGTSSETQGLLVVTMQYFSGKQQKFTSRAEPFAKKYCIIPTRSPSDSNEKGGIVVLLIVTVLDSSSLESKLGLLWRHQVFYFQCASLHPGEKLEIYTVAESVPFFESIINNNLTKTYQLCWTLSVEVCVMYSISNFKWLTMNHANIWKLFSCRSCFPMCVHTWCK